MDWIWGEEGRGGRWVFVGVFVGCVGVVVFDLLSGRGIDDQLCCSGDEQRER